MTNKHTTGRRPTLAGNEIYKILVSQEIPRSDWTKACGFAGRSRNYASCCIEGWFLPAPSVRAQFERMFGVRAALWDEPGVDLRAFGQRLRSKHQVVRPFLPEAPQEAAPVVAPVSKPAVYTNVSPIRVRSTWAAPSSNETTVDRAELAQLRRDAETLGKIREVLAPTKLKAVGGQRMTVDEHVAMQALIGSV